MAGSSASSPSSISPRPARPLKDAGRTRMLPCHPEQQEEQGRPRGAMEVPCQLSLPYALFREPSLFRGEEMGAHAACAPEGVRQHPSDAGLSLAERDG